MAYPKIICTIGPSSDSKENLLNLKNCGVHVARVNLSHATIDDLQRYIEITKSIDLELGIDTEGAQIRTKISNCEKISIYKNNNLKIYREFESNSTVPNISLSPKILFSLIKKGSLLRLDFNGALVKVIEIKENFIECECINEGIVGNNKGVDVLDQLIELPDFSEKDIKALELARSLGIKEIFISFCKSKQAIQRVKSIIPDSIVTSKIESKYSIHNLIEICEYSDAILIDRGDLTREINIMDIPFAQRGIIKVAKENNVPCYVATNVLESLIEGNLPTRAELNDIVSTIEMGAGGIVLAAETAIGKKPILCAEIVKELIHRYNLHKNQLLFADLERNEINDKEMKLWLNRHNKY
ncbi:Pyruvate kinase [Prochlorococcus marinus str. MIT 9215]|uniref:Pyruvate kinase n=1 Tax=Prochlorococcus marinus (strain MIT 9215) TaxID=93060 RepID=A8G605_PROM2|nr:pyruvate kinase [Prochlorococcus marinus]ABV51036.1 Pyruvate kinase [Prochlorococcus marinus str. MIT 9215]